MVNDVDAVADEIVLVLDGYHVIDAPDVQEGMAFLLDHLPQRLHLVIVTRADPALPLARLRARGELVEVRAADLRFTADEGAADLNGVTVLGLPFESANETPSRRREARRPQCGRDAPTRRRV